MRLAAITMQKNEVGLLRQWLSYYARLCAGFENLYIFDDLSNSIEVIEVLRRAEAQGVRVFWNNEKSWTVETKGILVSNLIKELGKFYDWFFPVDCDEFVCVNGGGDLPLFSRADVVQEIRRASVDGKDILRIKYRFLNIPHTEDVFFTETRKVAVRGGGAHFTLDTGYHLYNWKTRTDKVSQDTIADSNLAHLEFHYRPFGDAIKFAREKLKFRVQDFREETMINYSGAGVHLAYLFSVSEDEYYANFANKERLSIAHLFNSLDLPVPYSELRTPLTPTELQRLRNPLNLELKTHSPRSV